MRPPRHSAFIVANDAYADQRLRQLRAPAADAEELGRVLSDPDIGAFEVDVSRNEPEHVVRRRLSAFFDDRGLDDLLVLHLSCHGVKDDDGRLYFATADTDLEHLEATAIPSEFVNRQMTRSRSRRIVLLLDCCYSGAFAAGMLSRSDSRVDIKERFDGRGRVVLTASSAMEYSFEGDQLEGEGRPSVFTSALVRGLATGEADRNRDGWISVDELYDYAYDEVRAATPSQTPGKWVFGVQGDLYLARSNLPEPAAAEVSAAPEPPAPAPAPEAPAAASAPAPPPAGATAPAPPPAGATAPAQPPAGATAPAQPPAVAARPAPEIPDRAVADRETVLARAGAAALAAACLFPLLPAPRAGTRSRCCHPSRPPAQRC